VMHYAVNIADLTNTPVGSDICMTMLLTPVLDRSPIWVAGRKRLDEVAMGLDCDEERAKAIADVIRLHYKKHQVRVYYSRTGKGGWKRI